MMRILAIIAALLLPSLAARAETETGQVRPQVGDAYEILRVSESSEQTSEGSTGSSHDRDTLLERVIGIRDDGLELEYDLPAAATAQDRAASWQFPVRVFMPFRGPPQLLNRAELEARVDPWLAAGEMTRAACGHWIFTWNAFRIECDPDAVIEMIEPYDLRFGDLRDGALYQDPMARGPAPMTRRPAAPDGATFVVEMAIDPEAIRRGRAESDLVVAEIYGESLTLDAALRARADEEISGTIIVTLYQDSDGNVWRRTRVVRIEVTGPADQHESRTATETVERRPVSRTGS